MSEGSRERQTILGVWLVAAGTAILLVPVVFLEQIPDGPFAWIGGASLLAGSWLVSPLGLGGLFQQARDSWHEFRGHDESA